MKIDLDRSAANTIIAYDEGNVRVHGSIQTQDSAAPRVHDLNTSVIVTPDSIIEHWHPSHISELAVEHMQTVLACEPEIVLLGTGRRLQFPGTEVSQICHDAGIGLEVMDTGAACRTYNILAMEGRRVVAALLMIESARD